MTKAGSVIANSSAEAPLSHLTNAALWWRTVMSAHPHRLIGIVGQIDQQIVVLGHGANAAVAQGIAVVAAGRGTGVLDVAAPAKPLDPDRRVGRPRSPRG